MESAISAPDLCPLEELFLGSVRADGRVRLGRW